MTLAKRQHWVPRFYLKYFAIPETTDSKIPKVWIFHRKQGDPQPVAITKIAVQKFLYSPLGHNGSRDFSREMDLAELEDTISQIWPRLANDFVDLSNPSTRKGISLFLATLILRHPYTFDKQRETRRQLIELVQSAPMDKDGLPDIECLTIGSKRVRFDKQEWRNYTEAGENEQHWFFVNMIRAEAIWIAEKLMEKRWSMVFMDTPLFVTSDNPFFVLDQDKKREQILGKNSKLMFPVSPTRVLCLDDLDEPRNQYYKVGEDQAGVYNTLTWVNTDDFMISPREIDQVLLEIDTVRRRFQPETIENSR